VHLPLPDGGPQGHLSKLQASQVQLCPAHFPDLYMHASFSLMSLSQQSVNLPSSSVHSPGCRACLTPKLPSLVVAEALLLHWNESCMSQARIGSGNPLAQSFFLPQHPHCTLWIIPGEIYASPTCSKKKGVPLVAFAPSAC
jgi:hypothetical protein